MLKKIIYGLLLAFIALIAGFNLWGMATLGTHPPDDDPFRDPTANAVVMVFGATGSVGDGLLKAAMQDREVERIYAVTRRMSPRLEAGQASGRVQVITQSDFTDYSAIGDILADVNTVL
jgi:hypothetical protein